MGWAVPFVTGYNYSIYWGSGLDFTSMTLEANYNWEPSDNPVIFRFNHTDRRDKYVISL